jgi:hypothetical protein
MQAWSHSRREGQASEVQREVGQASEVQREVGQAHEEGAIAMASTTVYIKPDGTFACKACHADLSLPEAVFRRDIFKAHLETRNDHLYAAFNEGFDSWDWGCSACGRIFEAEVDW